MHNFLICKLIFLQGSLLGPQDTALVQNDVIQDYIETNNVQFMQLPDSSCEVIRTLQYYESRILTNSRTFPECVIFLIYIYNFHHILFHFG